MNSIGTIALVEWNWSGHHPTYYNHLILALEELGINVLALCPYPEEVERTANHSRSALRNDADRRGFTQFRKIIVPNLRFSFLRPARLSAIDLAIRRFTVIEMQVRDWMRESGQQVDAIYYACAYDFDFQWVSFAVPFLRFPWYAHYMHVTSYRRMPRRISPQRQMARPEKMFGGRLCKGISILDEGVLSQVSKSLGKPVVVFPDLADERLETEVREQILGERLKQFANGRPIVGLFGKFNQYKGMTTFLKAARMPAASEICFALGGEVDWYAHKAESSEIQISLAESSNIWNHLARIPSEPGLSYLMDKCDVLVAAYLDFQHSSGIQTKAAVLKKPMIVSDGYLMAERARRFKLGEVIPQGNATALLEAITRITKNPAGWVSDNKPLWREYCLEHSFDKLKSAIRKLFVAG